MELLNIITGAMPYKIVTDHDDGLTIKQIAASAGLEFSGRGEGFYQLVKKEKVSASKRLVLYSSSSSTKKFQLISDDAVEVRRRCGLAVSGEISVEPKQVPANLLLFVQSTSPNRKIAAEAAVLIVVEANDDDEEEEAEENEEEEEGDEEDGDGDGDAHDSKRQKSGGPKMAIKFDALLTAMTEQTCDGDPFPFFNTKVGESFKRCDEVVPDNLQKDAVFKLSLLFGVDWDESSFEFEIENDDCYGISDFYSHAHATGKLTYFDRKVMKEAPVRVEYHAHEEGESMYFAAAIGKEWGIVSGSAGCHPFIWNTEIMYENSDGSSSESAPSALPKAATNTQRINAVISHGIKWFLYNASDIGH